MFQRGERKVDVVELCEFVKVYGKATSFFLPELARG
jgi:hypothetical protein